MINKKEANNAIIGKYKGNVFVYLNGKISIKAFIEKFIKILPSKQVSRVMVEVLNFWLFNGSIFKII